MGKYSDGKWWAVNEGFTFPNKSAMPSETKAHFDDAELNKIASLEREITRLRRRNKELEDKIYLNSWDKYPDRMGS